MRILYITTIGKTMRFFESFIKCLVAEGHYVDIATNDEYSPVPQVYYDLGCHVFRVSFSRSPMSLGNVKAGKELKAIIHNGEYDMVHCHTPVASFVTRIVCKGFRKAGLKVYYTAHGFHFYKGAPSKNWLLFYPLEWLCSFLTDTLITINAEDHNFSKKHLHAKNNEIIPGAGIVIEKFSEAKVDRVAKRHELGIPKDAFLLVSVGELNKNKNHEVVIRALAKIVHSDIHYMIAGKGHLQQYLQELSEELGIAENVHILGYRNDVPELFKAADAEVFPSIREGFGLVAPEGMAAGLPVICSDNRGTREYMPPFQKTGFSGVCRNADEFAYAIETLYADDDLRNELIRIGSVECKKYSEQNVNRIMRRIYGLEP